MNETLPVNLKSVDTNTGENPDELHLLLTCSPSLYRSSSSHLNISSLFLLTSPLPCQSVSSQCSYFLQLRSQIEQSSSLIVLTHVILPPTYARSLFFVFRHRHLHLYFTSPPILEDLPGNHYNNNHKVKVREWSWLKQSHFDGL